MLVMKGTGIVLALVLLVGALGLLIFGRWADVPEAPGVSVGSGGPGFEVEVVRPRVGRPLFGILPAELEEALRGDAERFDHGSPGAEVGVVGPDALELRAEGWELSLEIDGGGNVDPGARLVFPFAVGGRLVGLRCRPADPAVGHLRTTPRPGDGELEGGRLDGSFLVELTHCENARSGKTVDWPPKPPFGLGPAPLVVRGSFVGLAPGRR